MTLEANRVELARAQRDLEKAIQAIRDRRELLDDTSRAAQDEVAKLKRDLLDAQRRANFEMTRLMREDLPRVMARTEARAAMRVDQEPPAGWIGVYFSGAPDEVVISNNGEKTVRYHAYPLIVSVEPGSPAERAGISAGDRLLSLGGVDMTTGALSLERLLQPGRTVPVRVKRAGDVRTVVVNVGRRPDDFVFTMMPPPAPGTPPQPPVLEGPGSRVRIMRTPGSAPVATVAPMPPMPPMSLMGPMGLAGAELTPMQPDLAEYFGTGHGLLVVRLSPGTPAERAGLRAGDVILGADGTELRTIRTFQMVLERAGDRSVKIDFLRKREKKSATLTW
ncbi:MAG: PDZ domain-containing protein [Gemmatimonadota bacterium]|nr:PDZ domain-containing protein [Gemmatimonadota bacterium]